jgi:regulator of sigma D
MIAVRSGSAQLGQWLDEKRNLLEDYWKCFGEDPPKAGAVAIMTDTDNTGEHAVAWYGPIRLISKGH